eukprot:scaffold9903_cov30-Tisochrysis_lutea.AAC.1
MAGWRGLNTSLCSSNSRSRPLNTYYTTYSPSAARIQQLLLWGKGSRGRGARRGGGSGKREGDKEKREEREA